MRALVQQFRKNPYVRTVAAASVQQVAGKDWLGEMGAVLDYVRDTIKYQLDINEVETIQTPLATLTLGYGDCDDMATLLCAMLEAIGFSTKFVAIGFQLGQFDHVYMAAQDPDSLEWIDMDATEPNPVGWAPPGETIRIDFYNSGQSS